MSDQELLDSSLARLRNTGAIEYTGEFGNEITTFIPFAHWLKREGHLKGRKVVTYKGMRPYYYFLDDDEYAEKPEARVFHPFAERDWPSNSSYTAIKQLWHVMPDYRARYASQGQTFEKPILFIQNKFAVEWGVGPTNFMSLRALAVMFAYTDQFTVIYSRPRAAISSGDYSHDHNKYCDYPDFTLAKEFPAVMVLEDHCAENSLPYNQTKLEILAKTYLFAAVQGGGSHLLACFGNSLIALLHRRGDEYQHAYAKGPYKYLSDPPPKLVIALDHMSFSECAQMLGSAKVHENGITVDGQFAATLAKYKI